MKNRHRKCGGFFFFWSPKFLWENMGKIAEVEGKAALVFMNFGK